MKTHLAYDDAGNVVAFLETNSGAMLDIGQEQVDWQRFDTAAKAKEAAAVTLSERMANEIETAALVFRRGWANKDLS